MLGVKPPGVMPLGVMPPGVDMPGVCPPGVMLGVWLPPPGVIDGVMAPGVATCGVKSQRERRLLALGVVARREQRLHMRDDRSR